MSILDQISGLLETDIDDIVDRAENPEAQLDRIIRCMESTLRHAAAEIAEQLIELKRTRTALDYADHLVTMCQQVTDLAVSNQQAAREHGATAQLGTCKREAQKYLEQLNAQMDAVAQIMSRRDALWGKYHDLLDARDALVVRARRAAEATAEKATPSSSRVTIPNYFLRNGKSAQLSETIQMLTSQ